jgi:hypothetical protein
MDIPYLFFYNKVKISGGVFMTYIERISFSLGERSEVPNQVLAKELALESNKKGIKEIYSYLFDDNKSKASDCLKVLYEIGYIKPELISCYLNDFVGLLDSKNNRMVWGCMIAIANIANVEPFEVYKINDKIKEKIVSGSLITQVWGIYALVNMIKAEPDYYSEFKEMLFDLQRQCRAIDFAKRALTISEIVVAEDINEFIKIISVEEGFVSKSAQKKLDRLIKHLSSK